MAFNVLEIAFIIGVAVLALINCSIYDKLSEYLYMSAGVKNRIVHEYLSYHNRSVRKLYQWLERVAIQPDRFKKMKRLCFESLCLIAFSVIVGILTMLTGQILIIEIYFILSLLFTVIISKSGFSLAKQIKADFNNGMVYDPNNREYINELAESKHSGLIELLNIIIYKILPFFLPFIIIGSFLVCGIMIEIRDHTNEPVQESQINETYDETDASVIINENLYNAVANPEHLFDMLAAEGIYSADTFSTVISAYPQYSFENAVRANGSGMSFTCYSLVNENDVNDFCSTLVSSLEILDMNSETVKVNNHTAVIYSNQTEYGQIYIICCEKNILYIECDNFKSEWLNTFLENLV